MLMNASQARKRLFPLIKEINDDHESVHITSLNGDAVLVPYSDWQSIQDTIHLINGGTNIQHLARSIEQYGAGIVETIEGERW